MNKTLPILALGIAGLAGATFVLAARGRTPPGPGAAAAQIAAPDDDSSRLLSALEQRIEALESRPAIERAAAVHPQPSLVETVEGRAPVPSHPPMTPADMDKLVETEARDVAWAPKYERDVTAALVSEFKDDHVREATCATSVCRIVVEHDSPANESQFISRFWTALPDGLAGGRYERELDASGAPRTVLHLVRKGHEDVM